MAVFLLIFLLLMMVYALLIDYYRRAWNQLPFFENDGPPPQTRISVIIPVRNEEKNIQGLLQSLDRQTYSKHLFQVIIIDDHSTDSTWQNLQEFKSKDLNTTIIQLSEFINKQQTIGSYKKKAIETGIRLSAGELIVTTDADCRFNPIWLLTMARFYETKQAKFIAAPVKIQGNGSLLSLFQTLDFLTLQGITGASVHKHFHSMCNGANLAYEKAAFYEVNGFEGIDHIASGDDMLLMHKIFKKYPGQVFYLKNIAAIVSTRSLKSWKEFIQQRIRWASKADSYTDKKIFWVLMLVYILNACFLFLTVATFWNFNWFFFLLLLLAAKILIELPFVNAAAIFFDQQSLMKYFPLFQPLHILYTVIAGWFGKFASYEWKGRRIPRKSFSK